MNFRKKRGKIGREKESLSQLTDSFITGSGVKRRIIIPTVFLALLCLSTTAFGVCCHPADTNCDNEISTFEILGYIDQWAVGDVTMLEVLEGIDLWAAVQYHCDQSGNYIPGAQP